MTNSGAVQDFQILENIRKIILDKNDWMEIREIADIMGVKRHEQLFSEGHNSTIAQLINRFLKKQGFKTRKVEFEDGGYSISVCAPAIGEINSEIAPDDNNQTQANSPKSLEADPQIVLQCINKFNGGFGIGGIVKILHGSQALKDNDYNKAPKTSEFFGIYSHLTQKSIESVIKKLIEENKIEQVTGFRPVLKVAGDFAEAPKPQKPKVPPPEESPVDEEDSENLNKITELIKSGENVFITGYAGTGKSYILNKLKTMFKIDVTSTTGLAAVNVQGQTIHSWAGVGICNKPINNAVENILRRPSTKKQIFNCKILAIDEISMLDARTIDYIDNVLKILREEDKPFGGIQVLFFGDFFQLPPVEKESGFCFDSNCWKDLNLKTVFLEKIYRQKDERFIRALSNMRTNSMTEDDIDLLRTRQVNYNTYDSDILHIFSTNREADNYNNFKFNALKKPVHCFNSTDKIHKKKQDLEIFDKYCKAPHLLELKEGCKVMLLKNHSFVKGLINGSCGTVLKIEEKSIMVKFDNGLSESIPSHTFEYYKDGELAVTREQYPLRLAYGITIHKSQGMTLDSLVVDCNRIFECGQAYVAISRVKALEGLYLRSFNPAKVMVNEQVINFYDSLKVRR